MRYFHLAALPLAAQAFSWGTATASYQIEGARSADGRQPSVWDAFDTAGVSEVVKAVKPNGDGNIYGDDTGAVADNDYVLFAQSVNLTASLGFDVVRLSVAWPRVMSYSVDAATGSMVWKKNEAGLAHYADVLRAYAARDIKVALTMFHWDLPLALEEYAATQPCESAWLCPWIGEYVTAPLLVLVLVLVLVRVRVPLRQRAYARPLRPLPPTIRCRWCCHCCYCCHYSFYSHSCHYSLMRLASQVLRRLRQPAHDRVRGRRELRGRVLDHPE